MTFCEPTQFGHHRLLCQVLTGLMFNGDEQFTKLIGSLLLALVSRNLPVVRFSHYYIGLRLGDFWAEHGGLAGTIMDDQGGFNCPLCRWGASHLSLSTILCDHCGAKSMAKQPQNCNRSDRAIGMGINAGTKNMIGVSGASLGDMFGRSQGSVMKRPNPRHPIG